MPPIVEEIEAPGSENGVAKPSKHKVPIKESLDDVVPGHAQAAPTTVVGREDLSKFEQRVPLMRCSKFVPCAKCRRAVEKRQEDLASILAALAENNPEDAAAA